MLTFTPNHNASLISPSKKLYLVNGTCKKAWKCPLMFTTVHTGFGDTSKAVRNS